MSAPASAASPAPSEPAVLPLWRGGGIHPLSITYRPLSSLIPYARNARMHSDAQVAEIAASIAEFGWTNPVLVDGESGIIAGHGRVMAARKLGLETVPIIELSGLSEAQKRAYILADNKLALNAGWDDQHLGIELGDLQALGFDIALTGFGEDEVARLLSTGTAGLTDPDDVPDAPAEPSSRTGDLWHLGRHRLFCGDSTNVDDVARMLAGVVPHLMVTDPPYGVSYDPAWRVRSGIGDRGNTAVGTVMNDDRSDWREAWALFSGDVAYIWHGGLHAAVVADSMIASGFALRSQIIWDKGQLVLSRGDYHWSHEPCWYAVREKARGHWAGNRKQTTVWAIPKPKRNETGHSTQKPVASARLSASAKAEWKRLVGDLHAKGIIGAHDRAALAAYCQAYGRWVEAERKLAETPVLIKLPSGYIQQSPWLAIANKQLELIARYAAELGFSPVSRGRVTIRKPASTRPRPADEFLGPGRG